MTMFKYGWILMLVCTLHACVDVEFVLELYVDVDLYFVF